MLEEVQMVEVRFMLRFNGGVSQIVKFYDSAILLIIKGAIVNKAGCLHY